MEFTDLNNKNIDQNLTMSEKKFLNKQEHAKHLEKYNIQPNRAMLTIILSILVDVFGYSMVLPLLPSIVKDFGASDFFVGILISSNAFTAMIFGPIWGKLSDKYGRKRILVISQAGTGLSFLILATSNSVYIIMFSRILDGVFGGQIPVIRAYISDITTPTTRSAEMSKIMVGHVVGMIIGPIIGGFLGSVNWRYPAILASFLSIIAIILTLKVLIESMPKERIADIKLRLTTNENTPDNNKSIWNKEVNIRLAQIFLLFMITVMVNSSFPLFLDNRYGAGPMIIGSVMSVAGIVVMFYAGVLMKPMLRKFGEKRVLIFGFILIIVTFLFFPYLTELWMVYVFVIPFAFCMSIIPPLIQSNLTKAVDQDKQGEASGWTTNFQSISQIIAPLVSTGFLEIGGLVVFSVFFFNSYQLIGFTAVLLGIALLIVGIIDLKSHPYLYAHDEPKNKEIVKEDQIKFPSET